MACAPQSASDRAQGTRPRSIRRDASQFHRRIRSRGERTVAFQPSGGETACVCCSSDLPPGGRSPPTAAAAAFLTEVSDRARRATLRWLNAGHVGAAR